MEKSDPFHVQKGIGAALLVAVGSPVGLEAHVPVEADGLRVLLVDCDLPNAVVFRAVFQQPPTEPGIGLRGSATGYAICRRL